MTLVHDAQAFEGQVSQARVGDYLALLKPRVMSLVVFTAMVGIVLSPGGLHPFLALLAIACIAVGAGASGALNMWYDADIDAVMSRTVNRPIPAGRISRQDTLVFGVVLAVASVVMLGLATNWLAAGLLAFTIFFYIVVYTMGLKRRTPQNIVIGGAAGAFPPLVGWAAVTGSIDWLPVVMFAIIFLWTPPHFWALALYKRGDYEAAGVPMMPNVAGDRSTKTQILVYSIILAAAAMVPGFMGFGAIYTVVAAVTGIVFIALAWRLWRTEANIAMKRGARTLFSYSLSYLFVLFLALVVDFAARGAGVL